jgi:hypothetical protein
VPGDEVALRRASNKVAAEMGIYTVHFVRDVGIPALATIQIVVGPATLQTTDDEAVAAFARLRHLAS